VIERDIYQHKKKIASFLDYHNIERVMGGISWRGTRYSHLDNCVVCSDNTYNIRLQIKANVGLTRFSIIGSQ